MLTTIILFVCFTSVLSVDSNKSSLIATALFYTDEKGRILLVTGNIPNDTHKTIYDDIQSRVNHSIPVKIVPVFGSILDVPYKENIMQILKNKYPEMYSANIPHAKRKAILNDMRKFMLANDLNPVLRYMELQGQNTKYPISTVDIDYEEKIAARAQTTAVIEEKKITTPTNNNQVTKKPMPTRKPTGSTTTTVVRFAKTPSSPVMPDSTEEVVYENGGGDDGGGGGGNGGGGGGEAGGGGGNDGGAGGGGNGGGNGGKGNGGNGNGGNVNGGKGNDGKGGGSGSGGSGNGDGDGGSGKKRKTTTKQATSPYDKFIPNDIYYGIEKGCANWNLACDLRGPQARELSAAYVNVPQAALKAPIVHWLP